MTQYTINYGNSSDNIITIQYIVTNVLEKKLTLRLPAWRPGRYELGNFGQFMFVLTVEDELGNPIDCVKKTKDSWSVNPKGSKTIICNYRYACNIKNAGGTFKSPSHFVLTPVNSLIFAEERIEEKCEILYNVPSEFDIASSLETNNIVSNYYELAASPLVFSKQLQRKYYTVNGVRFHVCVEGNVEIDWGKILYDFERFTVDQLNLFPDFPCTDYYFLILVFDEKHYHGVEHLNSTLIALGPDVDFNNHDFYLNLLGISSHELFHFWNICRIRPLEMSPYNYSGENYFETGYIAEGVTTYYGDYILGRSQTITEAEFLNEMSKTLNRHLQNNGRYNVSVAESSLDLWLDGYKLGIKGRKVSIYAKGATIAFMLDLWIRKVTANHKNLDDVMVLMWNNHGKIGVGYTSQDYQKYIEEITEESANWFFEDYVFGITLVENTLYPLLNDFGMEIKSEEFEIKGELKNKYVLTKLNTMNDSQLQNYKSWMLG